MAGTVHLVMRLLLLSFIRIGVNGEESLILAERGYNIKFRCKEDLVCFHLWQIISSIQREYIAIVSNGEIQTAKSEEKKCTLRIRDITVTDVGRHRCRQRPNVFSRRIKSLAPPALTLMPAKTVSLQCVFLTYVEWGHCFTWPQKQVYLIWVDEAGAEIQDDSQHQLHRWSSCDITLTVTFQSPGNKTFRCQATVDKQVSTSVEWQVTAPAPKGKGRGIIIEEEPKRQGGNRDTIGAAVGVVGCLVLTAVVAVFVVNRRRTNSQLPNEPCAVQSSTSNDKNTDDVVYADVILPVGSDQVCAQERESTEYACVRYK